MTVFDDTCRNRIAIVAAPRARTPHVAIVFSEVGTGVLIGSFWLYLATLRDERRLGAEVS